ncbi:MAG: FmdB family zinc ribbon protein [Limisphaerales bacterium]|nr:FmdB family transcriptional regulator [Pedosphaera sp.]RZO71393.1 MAG: zinc ribbon domain-containing protein [Limisphaerales bacterium]HAW02120.1 zinc ribbon domain-containing protein [Verrucomicrobiales bacterium]HBP56187.1 zinc ribbon domain-containing protein [Verrucomicrobiales bacterium]HCP39078.1 zinc ribbon domain-containing protein [Verrucomicrobiales bacterium]
MPIYEFKCGNCKKDHEILVRSHNWSGTPCPACGANQLQKKLSVFAASSSESEATPPCSGTPSSCGRCNMDD